MIYLKGGVLCLDAQFWLLRVKKCSTQIGRGPGGPMKSHSMFLYFYVCLFNLFNVDVII